MTVCQGSGIISGKIPQRKIQNRKEFQSKMLDERSLLSQFVRFSTATVASLMVFSLYSIVDGLFVARGVGEYAMSAVNLSAPFLNLLFSIAVIFAVGTSTILSIFLGQGKRERANSLFSQNVTLLTVAGVVITVLVFLFLEPVAKLLGAEGVTLPYTKDYLAGLALFAVCFIISYNMEILIKTDGYPQLAIQTVITGCLTNCVLDYVAIFHLDLGVWGAAVATGLSQMLTCVIYLRHFIRGKTTFHFVRFQMDWRIYRRLIPIGISDGVNELCNGLMILLFNHMILRCIGQEGLVSYTIIAYTNTLVINVMMGISQGSQPLVSFHYGKEDAAGCRKLLRYGFTAVAVVTAVVFLGIVLLAPWLVQAFLSNTNPELNLTSVHALRRYSLCYLILGVYILIGGFLTAAERPRPAICISVGRGLVLQAGALMVLAFTVGGSSIWFAPLISELLCLVLSQKFLRNFLQAP